MTDDTRDSKGQFSEGDGVWYRQTSRGGYGFQRDVPAVFVAMVGGRGEWASIEVELKSGGTKRIRVLVTNIRPRLR